MVREFDPIALYFGDDYEITDKIRIRQPKLDDVIRIGEQRYYAIVHMLTGIPSDNKSALWDIGIDYMEISDLMYFHMMTCRMSAEDCGIFLPGVNLSKFGFYEADGIQFMYDEEADIKIDMRIHSIISKYICTLHGIKPKVEKAANDLTKQVLIEDDRSRKKRAAEKEYKSSLLPMVSSLRVLLGCSKNEIRDMGMAEFMDAIKRVQLVKSVEALTSAYYSGNIDTKKFDVKKLDYMRDLQ